MILGMSKGCYKLPLEEEFKILGCMMNRQGKTCDAVEEIMPEGNKAFWKDIKIFKSKDVLWRSKTGGSCVPWLLFWKYGRGHSRQWIKFKGGRPKY